LRLRWSRSVSLIPASLGPSPSNPSHFPGLAGPPAASHSLLAQYPTHHTARQSFILITLMPRSMKTPATLYLPLVLAAGWPVLAVNDWSVPCTQGQCSWNLPADSGASGTVHIWGSPNAISDITIATGWRITSCDPSAMTQDIQLVCEGDNPDCDHLFQGGAVHTIVRLPDNKW